MIVPPAPPAASASTVRPPTPPAADALRWIGILIGVGGAILRASTTYSPLPYWDLDPLTFPATLSGLGPAASMLLDSAIVLGAALILTGQLLAGHSARPLPSLLALVGAAGVLIHGRDGLASQAIGATWIAAILLGLAMGEVCREPRFRRVVIACFAAFIGVLALKGAHQVLVEHAQTVRQFRLGRDAFLAAQGWTPDSAMARAYERRLNQNDATGWFGLSNVYASFAAAGTVMLAAIAAGALANWRRAKARAEPASIGPPLVTLAAFPLAGAALVMSDSRGGVVAAALGLAVLIALALIRRGLFTRLKLPAGVLGGIVGLGALAATLALIVLRAQLGEHTGGLSLLFRWHYLQAAVRIALGHPITGVGPDGFQQAYLLAKNPLNPEEVSSPHDILLDWWADLGLFGLAWCALLLLWVWSAGARGAANDDARQPGIADSATHRTELRCALGIGALATLAASWLEQSELTADTALIRLGGLLLWALIAWAFLSADRVPSALARLGVAAGAIALVAHALIDVTGSWMASAPLFALLVGTAAAGASRAPARSLARAVHAILIAASLLLAAWTAVAWARPAFRWQSHLAAAAARVRPIADLSQDWQSLVLDSTNPQERRETAARVASGLAALTGHPVDPSPDLVARAFAEAEAGAIPLASDLLEGAAAQYADQWKLRREASRIRMRRAADLMGLGRRQQAESDFVKAIDLGTPPDPERAPATAYAWLGLMHQTQAEAVGDRTRLQPAAAALETAARKDPWGIEYSKRLMKLYAKLGDTDRARTWAAKALELERLGRLDPLVRSLTDEERREAHRLTEPQPTPPR